MSETQEQRIERLVGLARKVWPSNGLVVEESDDSGSVVDLLDYYEVLVDGLDGDGPQPVETCTLRMRVPSLDALEAALRVLAGES